jgi:hypothetical protein
LLLLIIATACFLWATKGNRPQKYSPNRSQDSMFPYLKVLSLIYTFNHSNSLEFLQIIFGQFFLGFDVVYAAFIYCNVLINIDNFLHWFYWESEIFLKYSLMYLSLLNLLQSKSENIVITIFLWKLITFLMSLFYFALFYFYIWRNGE